jgi:hypothetical protein
MSPVMTLFPVSDIIKVESWIYHPHLLFLLSGTIQSVNHVNLVKRRGNGLTPLSDRLSPLELAAMIVQLKALNNLAVSLAICP